MMSEDLYFIALIEEALNEPDVVAALERAFGDIECKGVQEPYINGHRNFEQFMDIAYSHREAALDDYVHTLIAELATGAFVTRESDGELLWRVINSRHDWREAYDTFCREHGTPDLLRDATVVIQISRNGQIVGELCFDRVPGCKSMGGVVPGDYIVKLLDTGWTIWRGELTARELLQAEAFGEAELRFVAGKGERRPTGQKDLLNNGEIVLRTYAGIESGSIEIELMR
jgi:hypothetical protein